MTPDRADAAARLERSAARRRALETMAAECEFDLARLVALRGRLREAGDCEGVALADELIRSIAEAGERAGAQGRRGAGCEAGRTG